MTETTLPDSTAPLRFAVVGCGVIGRQHAETITRVEGAALCIAVDLAETAAKELGHEYGVAWTTSLDEALGRADVDAVAICTPSGNHAELGVQVLEAGKHVVVEKPLDVSADAAAKLEAAAAASSRTVTVISQHRFDPSSLAVAQAVREGRLGTITSGVASIAWWRSQAYYDSGEWRGTWNLDGGGALMNQGIHTIDLLVWMLGRPLEVSAYAGRLAHEGIEVEDTAVAIVRFEGGALGVVHGTTAAYPGLSARLQVHGSRGSAVIDDDRLEYFHAAPAEDDPDAPAYGAGTSSNQASLVLPQEEPAPSAGADPAALSNAHDLQYTDFLQAVREGREPGVTLADAALTLQVVLAIYRSAEEGRPVAIPARD